MEKTKKLRTICNIILLVLGLAAAIACITFAMGKQSSQGPLSFSMAIMYVMVGIALALILFFLILQIISDKKKLISVGLLLAVAVVVILGLSDCQFRTL